MTVARMSSFDAITSVPLAYLDLLVSMVSPSLSLRVL
jgi:hypothetical protein